MFAAKSAAEKAWKAQKDNKTTEQGKVTTAEDALKTWRETTEKIRLDD